MPVSSFYLISSIFAFQVSKVESLRHYVRNQWDCLPFTRDAMRRPQPAEGESEPAPWVFELVRRSESQAKEFESWPLRIVRDCKTEVYEVQCERVTVDGKPCCSVTLRGDAFRYHQIRYMMGAAIAVVKGMLPSWFLRGALKSPIAVRFPLAPSCGLILITAGFAHMHLDEGVCAMDYEQLEEVDPTLEGSEIKHKRFVLMSPEATQASDEFYAQELLPRVVAAWGGNERRDITEWRLQQDAISLGQEGNEGLEEAMAKKIEEGVTELSRRAEERDKTRVEFFNAIKRGEEKALLKGMGLFPYRLSTDLMVKFGLLPGRRLKCLQLGVAERMALSEGLCPLGPQSSTQEIINYIEREGLEELVRQGLSSASNWLTLMPDSEGMPQED